MTPEQNAVATACLRGAADDTMAFPVIVRTLAEAGFEGYAVDFRRGTSTYYLADGGSVALDTHLHGAVGAAFDAEGVRAAIREAQTNAPGYSYEGFCRKAAAAGCAGYVVSLSGRRAVYFGRTAETHVELFPS